MSLCNAANFDTVLAVYEEDSFTACQGTLVACNDDAPGCVGFTSELQFMASAGTFYLVQVGAFGPTGFGQGTLTITEEAGADPNDECVGAIPLTSASAMAFDTTNASTSAPAWSCANGGSDIWFSYTSANANDITVSLCGSSYDTALEVFSGSCGNFIPTACNDDSCGLQSETTFTPVSGTEYLIRVVGFNSNTGTGQILVSQDGQLGMNFCPALPNSTGQIGEISVAGSAVAADNDLTLSAASLPAGAFGFFITSTTQGLYPTPPGSAGNLCVLGDIGRYVGAGQIQTTDVNGTFSLVLDLTQTPQPTGLIAIQSGETWNFQAWHRDSSPQGATSNFTNAIELTFQ